MECADGNGRCDWLGREFRAANDNRQTGLYPVEIRKIGRFVKVVIYRPDGRIDRLHHLQFDVKKLGLSRD